MLPKVFVIAGNQEQFRFYKEKLIRERTAAGISDFRYSDIIYVHGINTFRGIRNPQGVFIGTWRNRSDIRNIFDELMICLEPNSIGRKVVSDLYVQYLQEIEKRTNAFRMPLQVFANGVLLQQNTDYTIAGASVTMTNPSNHPVSFEVRAPFGILWKGLVLGQDSLVLDTKMNIS